MASSSIYHLTVTGLLSAMLATMTTVGCSSTESPVDERGVADRSPIEKQTVPHAPDNRFASWKGRWVGVEGMYVDIEPLGKGTYRLEMRNGVDEAKIYTGTDDPHGIRFTRDQTPLLLYPTSGEEIDLKNLRGKKDCLIVKQHEGYCRA